MSVILGYKSENKIYLAADNRVTDKKDGSYSDKYRKLIKINNHLAMVCSGSRLAQDKFADFIKGKQTKEWTIDDLKFYLNILCYSLNLYNSPAIDNMGVYFIAGGLNENNQMELWSTSWNHKKYSGKSVEMALYPPEDVDMQTCCCIYIRNIHESFSNFMEKTIKEISQKGKMVSLSGDIWTYDIHTDKSSVKHFK